MRGYVEESEEVKARRALRVAALRYAASYLTNIGADDAELLQASREHALAVVAERVKPAKGKR